MDIYAKKSSSLTQKFAVMGTELALLLISAWLMFGPGSDVLLRLLGSPIPAGIPVRRYVIFAFSAIVFSRLLLTMFYLMRRRMGWDEAAGILSAFALYYLGFAIFVLPQSAPIGPVDYFAMALFAVGSFLNTGSELARDRYKKKQANKGRLYTEGLFAWSMHINFFGDVVWIAAYAIVAHTPWAALIPLFTFSFFAFYNVPMLDKHLAAHYGEQYSTYAKRTKRLVPLLW